VHVDVVECGTCLLDLAPEMPRYSRVIVVDAIRGGGAPGTIYRAEMPEDLSGELPGAPALSLHQWGVMETLQAAKLLGLSPRRTTLIGAEPACVQPGLELSPALERAGAEIVSTLLSELGC
jgi:hydrogenase maturation protease